MEEFPLPKVSVIIPVYNGELYMGRCLECLFRQTYPKENLEIIVVDDGSTDRTRDILNNYGIHYISTANRGPANARNEGIKAASGQILLFIDADCLADPDLVLYHVLAYRDCQKSDPRVQAIGGGIAGVNRNYWSVCDDFCSWYRQHPSLPPEQVFSHPTANLSISRRLAQEVRFDPELRFAEDFAFCTALNRLGYKIVFEPRAKVGHINRTSFPKLMKHAKDWASSQYALREKGIIKPGIMNPGLVVLQLLFYSLTTTWDILHSAFRAGRFGVMLCLPFIFLNNLVTIYYTFKSHLAFCRLHRMGGELG